MDVRKKITSVLTFALLGVPIASGKPIEIKAEKWLNAPSVRIPDDRDYVLFFFNTFQRERETVRWIAELNKLQRKRRGKIVVIGLSAEEEKPITKFAKKHNVRFTVGIHSRAYRDFKVKRLPHVVRIEADRPVEIASAGQLDQWFPQEQTPALPEWPDTFDESFSEELLRQFASRTKDSWWDEDALELLRGKMPSEEFMQFCDQLLASNPRLRTLGDIRYQKHLADPNATVKEPKQSPGSLARDAHRQNPQDPKWRPAHEYFSNFQGRSSNELFADYMAHMSDDPSDLLIRDGISGRFQALEADVETRSHLMDMFSVETDARCRLRLAVSFAIALKPGDFEAADFLEKKLETEANIRRVRPAMEYAISYLRTGDR